MENGTTGKLRRELGLFSGVSLAAAKALKDGAAHDAELIDD